MAIAGRNPIPLNTYLYFADQHRLRTLTIAKGLFGKSRHRTIRCKDNLARTYMAGGNAAAAIQAMTECVQLFTAHESVGPDHYLHRGRGTLLKSGWYLKIPLMPSLRRFGILAPETLKFYSLVLLFL